MVLFWRVLPAKAKVYSLLVLYGHRGLAAVQLPAVFTPGPADDGAAAPSPRGIAG